MVDDIVFEKFEYCIWNDILINFQGSFFIMLYFFTLSLEFMLNLNFYFTEGIGIHKVRDLERHLINFTNSKHFSMKCAQGNITCLNCI